MRAIRESTQAALEKVSAPFRGKEANELTWKEHLIVGDRPTRSPKSRMPPNALPRVGKEEK
jgi:hypothetical protein